MYFDLLLNVVGRYMYKYQERIPVEQAVKSVCDYKQSYTQFGGLRPFGVSFLLAGWDHHFGYQIYQTDPSGNYSGWKATVIGQNNQAGKSILKSDYNENNNVAANLKLAVKILMKTMDSSTATPERLEISVLRRNNDESIELVTLADAQVSTCVVFCCILYCLLICLDQVKELVDEITAQQEREQKEREAASGNM